MYTFKKGERLCSQKLIDELFHNGSSFILYPFRITWKLSVLPVLYPAQVVINVPKRRFKHAHDRNLLKRRIREAYRLNKNVLLYPYLKENKSILLSINYIGKEIHLYFLIEKKLNKAFEQLLKEYVEKLVE